MPASPDPRPRRGADSEGAGHPPATAERQPDRAESPEPDAGEPDDGQAETGPPDDGWEPV